MDAARKEHASDRLRARSSRTASCGSASPWACSRSRHASGSSRFAHHTARQPGGAAASRDSYGGAGGCAWHVDACRHVRRRCGGHSASRRTRARCSPSRWESFQEIAMSWAGLVAGRHGVHSARLFMRHPDRTHGRAAAPDGRAHTRVLTLLVADESPGISGMIVPLLIVFYAGELVWREREARLSEITDAAPVPEWVLFPGQVRGTRPGARRAAWRSMMAAGMLVQVILGHFDFEIGLYLADSVRASAPRLPPLRPARPRRSRAGESEVRRTSRGRHRLRVHRLRPGARESSTTCSSTDPILGWTYSDMRGFDPFIGPWLWFKLYWAAWALLLAVAATLLWVRGQGSGPRRRGSRLARRRFTRRAARADRGCGGPHPDAGRFHLLQHERAERVPDGLRWPGPARRIRAALRTVQGHPAARARRGANLQSRDLSRAAGGRDPRHVPSREHEPGRHRLHPSRHLRPAVDDKGRPLRPASRSRAVRRGARPPDLCPGDAAPARRLAAA